MRNKKITRKKLPGEDKSVSTSWGYQWSPAEEVASIEGVGRIGAPIRSLDIPGLSRKSAAQVKSLGVARVRITRPGSGEGLRKTKEPAKRRI